MLANLEMSSEVHPAMKVKEFYPGTISSAYETSISTYTLDLGVEIPMVCDGVRLEVGNCDVTPGK